MLIYAIVLNPSRDCNGNPFCPSRRACLLWQGGQKDWREKRVPMMGYVLKMLLQEK